MTKQDRVELAASEMLRRLTGAGAPRDGSIGLGFPHPISWGQWLQEFRIAVESMRPDAEPEHTLGRVTGTPDGIRVIVENMTGQRIGERVVQDDYCLVTAGNVFLKSLQAMGRTHMLAVGPESERRTA